MDTSNFDKWWEKNKPPHWWAKERGGQPMSERDQMLVTHLTRIAFISGEIDGINSAVNVVVKPSHARHK